MAFSKFLRARQLQFAAALFSACLSTLVDCPQANAQDPAVAAAAKPGKVEYSSIPINKVFSDSKKIREAEQKKSALVKGISSPYDSTFVKNYYHHLLLGKLTHTSSVKLANEARKEIREDIENASRRLSDADLKAFNLELYKFFTVIADGNYTPSARISSILSLGELNEKKETSSRPAKPLTAVQDKLLNWATTSDIDGIRAAALTGLERHIKQGELDEAKQKDVASKLLAAAKKLQTENRSDAANGWLGARYLGLIMLLNHGMDAEVYAYVTETLGAKSTHPYLRDQALLAFGAFAPAEGNDAQNAAAGVESMRYVQKRLNQWLDLYDLNTSSVGGAGTSGGYGQMQGYGGGGSGSAYGAAGGGGYGGTGGGYGGEEEKEPVKKNIYEEQDTQVRTLRRFMHQLIQTARIGMEGQPAGEVNTNPEKGLIAAVPSENDERDFLLDAAVLMAEIQVALDDENITDRAAMKDVRTKIESLLALVEEYPGVLSDDEAMAAAASEPTPEAPAAEEAPADTAAEKEVASR